MSGPRTSPTHVVVASTRRSWSRDQKRAIIAETREAGTTVSAVARRHGVQPSLLFRWRSDLLDGERAAAATAQPPFVPLALPDPVSMARLDRTAGGVIEIELAGGHRLRADASIDVAVLRSLIEALVGQ
jgi:transposase